MATCEQNKLDLAYQYIKNCIIDGTYQPMEDLSEDTLSSKLEMSKTPVHQALQQLSREGFVYVYPRKSTIVANLSIDTIRNVFETRRVVEPYLLKTVGPQVADASLLEKRETMAALVGAIKQNDDPKLRYEAVTVDIRFHRSIIEKTSNSFLLTTMERAMDYSRWISSRTTLCHPCYTDSIQAHIEIIDCMLARSYDAAAQRMVKHLLVSEQEAFQCYR